MPRSLPTESTLFVFAPALYPFTPVEELPVFVHGTVSECKQRNGELIVRGRDEKGEWEAYVGGSAFESLETGQRVRGFGIVESQPDGKVVLAARWIKRIEESEYTFCVKETQQAWEKILAERPKLLDLKPYVAPAPRTYTPSLNTPSKRSEPDEFVSASELKVERDFV